MIPSRCCVIKRQCEMLKEDEQPIQNRIYRVRTLSLPWHLWINVNVFFILLYQLAIYFREVCNNNMTSRYIWCIENMSVSCSFSVYILYIDQKCIDMKMPASQTQTDDGIKWSNNQIQNPMC